MQTKPNLTRPDLLWGNGCRIIDTMVDLALAAQVLYCIPGTQFAYKKEKNPGTLRTSQKVVWTEILNAVLSWNFPDYSMGYIVNGCEV